MTNAIDNTERDWFRQAADQLVAERGVDAARRVAEFHRRKPIPGARFYPNIIEQAIAAHERNLEERS